MKNKKMKFIIGTGILLSVTIFIFLYNTNLEIMGFEKTSYENGDFTYEFTGENTNYSVNLIIKQKTTKALWETITYSEEIRLLDNGSVYMYYSKNSMGDEECSDYRIIAGETNPSSCTQIEEMIKGSVDSLGFKKELKAMEKQIINMYEKK